MEIHSERIRGVRVLRLSGALKAGDSVEEYRAAVERALAAGDVRLLVDLGHLGAIDSSGIGVLVRGLTSARQRGGDLKLLRLSPSAMQTLGIVSLLHLFEVFAHEEEALASFAAAVSASPGDSASPQQPSNA